MYTGEYTGKILRIRLTDKTTKEEELHLNVAKEKLRVESWPSS